MASYLFILGKYSEIQIFPFQIQMMHQSAVELSQPLWRCQS